MVRDSWHNYQACHLMATILFDIISWVRIFIKDLLVDTCAIPVITSACSLPTSKLHFTFCSLVNMISWLLFILLTLKVMNPNTFLGKASQLTVSSFAVWCLGLVLSWIFLYIYAFEWCPCSFYDGVTGLSLC